MDSNIPNWELAEKGTIVLTTGNSMASWSLSFFPLPISMWRRKSTSGVSIDFNFINLLGFTCYAIYTATFLYSPEIRSQYAARHPAAAEPTVRVNDLAFAALGVIMCLVAYSMFWPRLSGLHTPRHQRVSWTMRGLFSGCVLAPLVVTCVVLAQNPESRNNPFSWAWIDVVSDTYQPLGRLILKVIFILCWSLMQGMYTHSLDLHLLIRQTCHYDGQVRPTGLVELSAAVDCGMEHLDHYSGSHRRYSVSAATSPRFQSTE